MVYPIQILGSESEVLGFSVTGGGGVVPLRPGKSIKIVFSPIDTLSIHSANYKNFRKFES